MLVGTEQPTFWKFFWQDVLTLKPWWGCWGLPGWPQRLSCLGSLKSVGEVLWLLLLQQQVVTGLDLGGRKQNLHFNVHMLSSLSHSPPKKIIVLLAGIIRAGQLCLPWLHAWGMPVCVWMLLLQGGSTARTSGEPGEKLSQSHQSAFFLNTCCSHPCYCELRRIVWSCYRLVIYCVTPTALWEQGCTNALKENALAFPVYVLAL